MSDLIMPYLGEILAAVAGLIVAAAGLGVAIFQTKKKKNEVEALKIANETEKLKLENEKLELERLMIEGAFIICPNCETKIKAKDMIFYTKETKEK